MKRRINTSTLQEDWKKLWNMKVTIIPIVIGDIGTVTKRLTKGDGGLRIRQTSGDHANDKIIGNC